MESQRIAAPQVSRTIETAKKKPDDTTPSITQLLQQSRGPAIQRQRTSSVVIQRMKIGDDIPLIPLSDGVAIRWWLEEGNPGGYSYDPWYNNVHRFAYKLGTQYSAEGKEFKDESEAIAHVYALLMLQKESATLVFPDKKEAGKPEIELRTMFIKQKMDAKGYVVLEVKELEQNDGKNNHGVFIVTARGKGAEATDPPESFFVKVVKELNNFEGLIKRQEGEKKGDPKKDVPGMTPDQLKTFAPLKDRFDVGDRAIGIFPAVRGITLLDLHRDWLCGKVPDGALISAWQNAGNVLSRFHNPELEKLPTSTRSGGRILKGDGLFTHGDLNPSNMMIDVERGSAMLIDIDGGRNNSEYSKLGIELQALFDVLDVGLKKTKGYVVEGCIKEGGNIVELYTRLLDTFADAYLNRMTAYKVFATFVQGEIEGKKSKLTP